MIYLRIRPSHGFGASAAPALLTAAPPNLLPLRLSLQLIPLCSRKGTPGILGLLREVLSPSDAALL